MMTIYNFIFYLFSEFIKHNLTIATWITAFLLTFPAYDIFHKRKKLLIILRNIHSSEATRTVNGVSTLIKWTNITVEALNQTDYPIAITEFEVNLYDKSKEREKKESYINITELEPRDNKIFSIQTNGNITKKDIFSITLKDVGKKSFKLYPNGKWRNIIKYYINNQ